MAAADIGIDLGTSSILVYTKGKGIVLKEPSVVAYDKDADKVKAIGEEARQMIGRTPGNIMAIRPLRQGVISDYTITEKMLKHFIQKAMGRKAFRKPRISICVPSGVTEVERKAVEEATYQAGAREVYIIEEPIAAAIGSGIDITKPFGNMVVDIGGGTTDIAVISLGGVVVSASIKVAGNDFDEAIIRHVRKAHNLFIGEQTAEAIKMKIGTVCKRPQAETMEVKGRNVITGLPKIKATEILAKEGFVVMPYMYPDLNAARALKDAGAACIMPLGAPIGSNKGLATKEFIQILIDEMDLPIIVDAGIGRPSQACEAMEMGAAAVMANTAIATAGDVPVMAEAFKKAIEAGRSAYLSGLGRQIERGASASSPLTGFLED